MHHDLTKDVDIREPITMPNVFLDWGSLRKRER
jgi:hypothetical protein